MFTIDADNNITAVSAAAEQIPDSQEKFATEKELGSLAANWPADRLVEIWNSFAGVAGFGAHLKPVRKFMNRKAGVRRIWTAIQKLATPDAEATPKGARKAAQVATKKAKGSKGARVKEGAAKARAGSKKAIILGMLGKGATISELMAAAGWQAHSVRGFLSTVAKKEGIKIESTKNGSGERCYKLAR